ncbi:MAG: M3 family oligoendopeptidase [Bdellovibrio sp.]
MKWNLESEYPSYTSTEFLSDANLVIQKSKKLDELINSLKPAIADSLLRQKDPENSTIETAQQVLLISERAIILISNLLSYLRLTLSVDSSLQDVQGRESELVTLASNLSQVMIPFDNFLKRCSEDFIQKVLNHPELKASEFLWKQRRERKDFLLSDAEETLLEAVSVPGIRAWGELYKKLSGSMRCQLKYEDRTETVGLAQAAAMIRSPDENVRKVAWHSIQDSWNEHKDSAAAILNSLVGWRHEVNKKRSHTKNVHFLDEALYQSRIQRETLDALMTACYENIAHSRKAPALMAKLMEKKVLDPWDLLAQSPVSGEKKQRSYDEALLLIQNAFSRVDPQMAEFVKMMDEKRWIEGRILPNKRNGAFCGGFVKSNEPRVFMTFLGSNSDVSTLAHELGHGFHAWVMRDLPFSQCHYPMTLAETASIFAETVLHDVLIEEATTKEEKIEFSWSEIENASSLLLNIPARFEFEKNFYELRLKRSLSADELSKVTDEAWTKWYGPTVTHNEKLFWATKLHFSMAGTSFYNFPYTFGYLFSMSIYARRKELGANFMQKYIEILRDTGRMTAENLVQKHLGEDIRRPEFWQKSIDVINGKIDAFEKLAFS